MVEILSVTLKNFKAHSDRCFEFQPGTNAISGENGAGKTNTPAIAQSYLIIAVNTRLKTLCVTVKAPRRSLCGLFLAATSAPMKFSVIRDRAIRFMTPNSTKSLTCRAKGMRFYPGCEKI